MRTRRIRNRPPERSLGAVPAHPVYPAYVGSFSPVPSSINWEQAACLFHLTLGDQVYNEISFLF